MKEVTDKTRTTSLNMKKEMTLYDALDIATRVNFLTERWEVKMYAIALREAFLWGKYVK